MFTLMLAVLNGDHSTADFYPIKDGSYIYAHLLPEGNIPRHVTRCPPSRTSVPVCVPSSRGARVWGLGDTFSVLESWLGGFSGLRAIPHPLPADHRQKWALGWVWSATSRRFSCIRCAFSGLTRGLEG